MVVAQVVEGFRKMSTAPSPSEAIMDLYRIYNGGSGRAANGELASLYGNRGQPIPSGLATAESDDLEPMAQLIRDRLMNPVIQCIVRPSKALLHILPMYRKGLPHTGIDVEYVPGKVVSAIANACVHVLATLVLIAPIAIFTVVEEQTLRIVVMPLFCLLLTASAQLMGPRSMPIFTLVTG